MCGEKRQGNMNKEVKVGSPPRMRGKVYLVQLYCGFARITPAYAGKSASTNADRFSVQDHPRVCGEKFDLRHLICG